MQAEFFPETRFFSFPPAREKGPDVCPVFLPFSGCGRRCLFCAQDIQTGQRAAPVLSHLEQAANMLEDRLKRGLPAVELGFFGGTFTALPPDDLEACLKFAVHWQKKGVARDFRCSTRPDCLDPAVLASLKKAGCTMVELGVQTFSDPALALSQRGYTGRTAEAGCLLVKKSGLRLGIQLMPGMPGQTPEAGRRDIELTASLQPDCVRLYPCLVLAGSALADLWRLGQYRPWNLAACVDFLAEARLRLGEAGISIARVGLADEPGLRDQVLAGPHHPALGNMVRGQALYRFLSGRVRDYTAAFPQARPRLFAPRRFQGDFWGHNKELVPSWAALGLTRQSVLWWERDCFALTHHPGIATRTGTLYNKTS